MKRWKTGGEAFQPVEQPYIAFLEILTALGNIFTYLSSLPKPQMPIRPEALVQGGSPIISLRLSMLVSMLPTFDFMLRNRVCG